MKTVKQLQLLSLAVMLLAVSACQSKPKDGLTDTYTSGVIAIAADESFQPIVQEEVDVFEGVFCKAFVTFNEKNIRFNLARKSTTAENKSCNALNLVRTLFVPGNFFAAFTKNMCNHLNGRCLAVTACYGNNIFRQLNSSENIWAEFKRNLSRQTAALAEQSSDKFQNLAHNNSK